MAAPPFAGEAERLRAAQAPPPAIAAVSPPEKAGANLGNAFRSYTRREYKQGSHRLKIGKSGSNRKPKVAASSKSNFGSLVKMGFVPCCGRFGF
jgi:hypothetical protein